MQNLQHKVNTLITKIKLKADLLRTQPNDADVNQETIERIRELLVELEATLIKEAASAC